MARSYNAPAAGRRLRPIPGDRKQQLPPTRSGWWALLLRVERPCVICDQPIEAGSVALRNFPAGNQSDVRYAHPGCVKA
jgi:hypothetical protein